MQATCGDLYDVLLVEFMFRRKLVGLFTPSQFECPDEIVFSESTNDFRSIVNHIGHTLVANIHIEKYSTLENNSVAVHSEILVAMVLDLV